MTARIEAPTIDRHPALPEPVRLDIEAWNRAFEAANSRRFLMCCGLDLCPPCEKAWGAFEALDSRMLTRQKPTGGEGTA
jgi:hypothetical protein